MTAEEFLKQLNPHSKVFELSIEYEYTEEQLLLFAKLYHESELKKLRVTDVSGALPMSEIVDCGKDGRFKLCNVCGNAKRQ